MSYTQRQQQIATLIAERGNLSTVEYLLGLAVQRLEVDGQQWQDSVQAEPQRYHMFIPQWNQRNSWLLFSVDADTHLAVIDYLSVVRDLAARNLVTVLPDPKRHVRPGAIVSALNPPTVSDRDQAALEIDALLQTNSELLNLAIYTERVYALPSLHSFIDNGFLSTEERSVLAADQAHHQQLRVLQRLSVSMIVLASLLIFGALLALLWHFGTRSHGSASDHTSAATHTQQGSDSLPRALAPPTIQHDTVVIHDTVSSQPVQPKKKKRRRHIDLSE